MQALLNNYFNLCVCECMCVCCVCVYVCECMCTCVYIYKYVCYYIYTYVGMCQEDKHALFTLKNQQYWTRQLQDCASDSRRLWRDSRRLWRTLNSSLMHNDSTSYSSLSLKAQQLSTFFHDKLVRITAAIQFSHPAVYWTACNSF